MGMLIDDELGTITFIDNIVNKCTSIDVLHKVFILFINHLNADKYKKYYINSMPHVTIVTHQFLKAIGNEHNFLITE